MRQRGGRFWQTWVRIRKVRVEVEILELVERIVLLTAGSQESLSLGIRVDGRMMLRRRRMIMRVGIMRTGILMEFLRLWVWEMTLRDGDGCVMKRWSTNSG